MRPRAGEAANTGLRRPGTGIVSGKPGTKNMAAGIKPGPCNYWKIGACTDGGGSNGNTALTPFPVVGGRRALLTNVLYGGVV